MYMYTYTHAHIYTHIHSFCAAALLTLQFLVGGKQAGGWGNESVGKVLLKDKDKLG